jgi:hypothetical protein
LCPFGFRGRNNKRRKEKERKKWKEINAKILGKEEGKGGGRKDGR